MMVFIRFLKWIGWALTGVMVLLVTVFFLYSNSLAGINPKTLEFYSQLNDELKRLGYEADWVVISAKRADWHNKLLIPYGASPQSRHVLGDAIDLMVLDVNKDGAWNSKDVDIVYSVLNGKIMPETGGIGTYKSERAIWDRQMVHFDCRANKSRWNR